MVITAKEIRLLWWSMFWRFIVYTQVAYFLFGVVAGLFKDFLHDPTIHDLMHQHNVISDGLQGAAEAVASGIALTQAIRIHLPLIFSRSGK
jgi:hypothetical protein